MGQISVEIYVSPGSLLSANQQIDATYVKVRQNGRIVSVAVIKAEGDKTKVTWAMYGKNGFVGKAFSLFMDCEKMCGPEFEKGLADLAKVAAAPAK